MVQPQEHLTDPIDHAAQISQGFLERSIAHVRRCARQHQSALPGGGYAITDCVQCGQPIGEPRLRVSIKNDCCIRCATQAEHPQPRARAR